MAVALQAANKRIQGLISNDAMRQKELGVSGNKRLKRRLAELRATPTEELLVAGPGKWHPVSHDWPGCLSGTVTGDARIIVELCVVEGAVTWLIREIGHAYNH